MMPLAVCPHRPPCPGCPRYGHAGITPHALSALSDLAKAHGLPSPPVHEAEPSGYRHRARLAVRGRAGAPKLGLFREGTHQIVDIPNCTIHHPEINLLAREIKAHLKARAVAPYSDAAHAGKVRYLQFVVERSSQLVQLVLVTNSARYDEDEATLCESLAARCAGKLQGLFWNGQPERSNAILGPHWQHVAGAQAIEERLGGARVFFPAGAFGQSHLGLYDHVIERVQQWAAEAERIVELYAGTGGLSLGLLQAGASVTFNEVEPHSLHGLQLGLQALPDSIRARGAIAPGNAADAAGPSLATAPQTVIVDPPRKGLDAAVIDALLQYRPPQLIYLSCGLDSFLRDATRLCQGGYRLSELEAFALFPFSEHVETLARFTRP